MPDDADETPIDFAFFYFIGRAKLGLTGKEVGRLTLRTFSVLYQHYRDIFDLEMILTASHTTYAEAIKKSREADEWF